MEHKEEQKPKTSYETQVGRGGIAKNKKEIYVAFTL